VAWTVAVNRSTSFAALALVVLVGRRGLSYRSADLRPAAIIGLLDAGANALFALALTRGMTSTARARSRRWGWSACWSGSGW
jgi:hypothetical protein